LTFTGGTQKRYDLVIGADGLYSEMRELLLPEAPTQVSPDIECGALFFPVPFPPSCQLSLVPPTSCAPDSGLATR
jgi:2-polyprenyl-6-methoxyphenol hydroxylase-like FAD-dependent oxidoreductase